MQQHGFSCFISMDIILSLHHLYVVVVTVHIFLLARKHGIQFLNDGLITEVVLVDGLNHPPTLRTKGSNQSRNVDGAIDLVTDDTIPLNGFGTESQVILSANHPSLNHITDRRRMREGVVLWSSTHLKCLESTQNDMNRAEGASSANTSRTVYNDSRPPCSGFL